MCDFNKDIKLEQNQYNRIITKNCSIYVCGVVLCTHTVHFTAVLCHVQVLAELKEYATEVDVDFVRKAVRAIGRCAIKVEVRNALIADLKSPHVHRSTRNCELKWR